MISVLLTIAVFAGLIKGTVDFIKQLRRDIRRRDEDRRVIEYARLHNISIREADKILNHD